MNKIAFIFPGQGAQYSGMGQDFYENIPICKNVIDTATKITGLSIPELCFTENDKLHITEYTQIAILSVSVAILKALEERGIHSQINAGLSLGEYGAIVASKAMSMEDAFAVVRKRGIFMQEAYPTGGAMFAVLGFDAQAIEDICKNTQGIVSVANYNCPGQIVITGEEDAVQRASEALKQAGAKRIVPLKVSGPFHSALLEGAGKKLRGVLEQVEIQDIVIPYVTNVTADLVTDKNQVEELLVKQVSSSVKWQQCVERMIADGADTFIEIGPGKTLSGFMRKINRDVTMLNVQNIEDFEKVIEALQ